MVNKIYRSKFEDYCAEALGEKFEATRAISYKNFSIIYTACYHILPLGSLFDE